MFKGSIVAIVTPFKNGVLDEETYTSLTKPNSKKIISRIESLLN